ncbi:MAG: STAS domain-containing protein [Ignavibacterium sp.]|nr:STAS domain-containing protein [Melioribacteraceae bacterium]MCO6473489.1 STAS domain-containing protein [Melioribacteraceae bacterium]MDD3558980.1 STAS domain-containing protein [Melioribacteraceae bacterium]MDD5609872.1 STAS domain-containing protein [Ignavibacterium sp.]
MVSEFNLSSEVKDNCVVINTSGYVNNLGGQKIIDEFNTHHQKGIKNYVLNLAESKVVNSIGISFLIEVIEKLNDSNGKLVFANLDPSVDKTFTIMGLFHYAEKAQDVDEGIKLLQDG